MIEVHGLLTHNTCREEWGSRWETSFCLFAFPVCYLIPPCKLHTRVTDPCSESFYRERRRDRWKGLPSAGPQCSELSWSESGHQELLLGHTGGTELQWFGPLYIVSKAISRESGFKWRTGDMNRCPHWILTSKGRGLAYYATMQAPKKMLIFHLCILKTLLNNDDDGCNNTLKSYVILRDAMEYF